MTKYHVCGLSILLCAFSLSGCSSMAKNDTTANSIETGTVAPLVINTPSSEDVIEPESTSKTLVDTTPNTSKVTTAQILPKKSKSKQKVALKKKEAKGCRT